MGNVIQHVKMNTRSRARNGNAGIGDLGGISEHSPQDEVQQPFGPRRDEIQGRLGEQEEREQALPPPMIQLLPEALRQMIEDPQHEQHQGLLHRQQADDQLEEEVESIPSLPKDKLPPLSPEEAPSRERGPRRKAQAGTKQASVEETENIQAFPLAVPPPRRSPFATHILAEAIQYGIKIPNINEYDGTKDPQDHLDRFLAKADLIDISDTAYCKIFRTTLAGKAMTWFNQLPIGSIDNFEQLSQCFLHHFAINKRYPKTTSYIFTVIQRE
ncbi:hypothetical protein Sango_1624900 [Sesamum angolense]|uniref:Retrotransposon gag domain-containing protein n=1 Tax=Sesamum angolense TaxID=2727404 RepID=A0AAE1WJW7_9LAMI|nr:hypothetical protein Sango_1624900 [Sesamum angolense]